MTANFSDFPSISKHPKFTLVPIQNLTKKSLKSLSKFSLKILKTLDKPIVVLDTLY